MSEITLVIQYEDRKSGLIAHLAVMEPGAIRGYSYPAWENHHQLAHYLCTTDAPPYSGWDRLTVDSIERSPENGGEFCPKCFAGMSTS